MLRSFVIGLVSFGLTAVMVLGAAAQGPGIIA
ncbi:hypothetical protein FHR23_001323 [Stakelama sediminis]|uniref:Uncharacterized protein n=1 Tax=Stakelama sediminis TaxID=463200 RepID=A0A840YY26_9SPHN|nr:hypothetical protein [Stakelama sediminis]